MFSLSLILSDVTKREKGTHKPEKEPHPLFVLGVQVHAPKPDLHPLSTGTGEQTSNRTDPSLHKGFLTVTSKAALQLGSLF